MGLDTPFDLCYNNISVGIFQPIEGRGKTLLLFINLITEKNMTNTVDYEWTIEDTDSYGDILGTDEMSVVEAISRSRTESYIENCKPVLVLVRMEGNQDEGLLDRQYAYLKSGELPKEFDDGALVPKYILNQYLNALVKA